MNSNSTSPDTRIYAIGDLHGCLDLLNTLLAWIETDVREAGAKRNVLVFLGDYVDRGSQIKALVDRLAGGFPFMQETIYIRGNHEHTLMRFLAGEGVSWNWFKYGGLETLKSYDLTPPTDPEEATAIEPALSIELASIFPERHRQFMENLELHWSDGEYLFVHAGLKPGVALSDQDEHDLLWIRSDFLDSDADFGQVVVHGHTVTPAPEVRSNRIGIDTGAYANGLLTCVVLAGTQRQFAFTTEDGVQVQDIIK